MNVTVNLQMGDATARRKCGCLRYSMSDAQHFWKYNRVRYWFRGLRYHRKYVSIMWDWWWREALLGLMEWANPIHLVFGMVSYRDAQDREQRVKDVREANQKAFQEKLFLGASKNAPDGTYARNGWDMICMTEDESRHW